MTVEYRVAAPVSNEDLNSLFRDSWPGPHQPRDFAPVLAQSPGYVCAYQDDRLVGFANVAWDGGCHAFLLDTTVRPDVRRRGIGRELVRRAERLAREAGCEWLHVDFEPELEEFYRACGFKITRAGLIRLED
jgi:GNAT superfamily N-acetyltransferase